jgi:sorbitol-specific phosphotransferase system component IIBC
VRKPFRWSLMDKEEERVLMNRFTRKLGLGFAVLLAMFLMISTGIGQSGQSGTQKTEPSAQTVTIDGKVSAVSETSVTIVDANKAEKTIVIDANTKITKSGKDVTAADIKADDSVVVVAKADGDALTAISIKVA